MLAIKNNPMAANAARQLGKSYDALATSVERLSSGLRINSASDTISIHFGELTTDKIDNTTNKLNSVVKNHIAKGKMFP
jgi:flagellin-like hook-associated protein FlgL